MATRSPASCGCAGSIAKCFTSDGACGWVDPPAEDHEVALDAFELRDARKAAPACELRACEQRQARDVVAEHEREDRAHAERRRCGERMREELAGEAAAAAQGIDVN